MRETPMRLNAGPDTACGRRVRRLRVVSVVAFAIFGALAAAVGAGVSVPGDRPIYVFLSGYDDSAIGGVADFLASRGIEVVGAATIAAILLALVMARRIWLAALLAASFLPLLVRPALRITPGLTGLFDRQQPPSVHPLADWTFPSGHATGSMAIAAVAVIVAWPSRWRERLLLAASFFVPAVGLAAVIGGHHWPSDVVAGWSLTLGWVTALYSLAPDRFAAFHARGERSWEH